MFAHSDDPRARAVQPLEGITEWENPESRVFVCEVHYTADPDKRDPKWKADTMRGLDKNGWAREYEIAWEVGFGAAVFPAYTPATMRREVPVIPGARLLRFWDFGHFCPVTLFGQLDVYGRLRMLRELVLTNSSLEQQILSTLAASVEIMGQANPAVFDAGDPAGEKEMDLGSVRATLLRKGIILNCQPSNAGSYDNLHSRLLRQVQIPDGAGHGPNEYGGPGTHPALLVHPRCSWLNDALAGAFHRNEKTGKPVDVHPYKDVVDALRYGNDNLLGTTSDWMVKMKAAARADCAW